MDGKAFEDFKVYHEHSSQFLAIIKIPEGNKDTIGKDIENMLAKRQSFECAINSEQSLPVRSRLKRYWNELFALIEQAGIA